VILVSSAASCESDTHMLLALKTYRDIEFSRKILCYINAVAGENLK
jgi:hypothetical protein